MNGRKSSSSGSEELEVRTVCTDPVLLYGCDKYFYRSNRLNVRDSKLRKYLRSRSEYVLFQYKDGDPEYLLVGEEVVHITAGYDGFTKDLVTDSFDRRFPELRTLEDILF